MNAPKKSIRKKRKIQTEEEFGSELVRFLDEKRLENTKAGAKLNLGDNLTLAIKKDGAKYFQLLSCIKGKSSTTSIGKYPDISFNAAREKADALRSRVLEQKKVNSQRTFEEKLIKRSMKKEQQIPRETGGLQLLFNTLQRPINSLIETKETKEIHIAIILLLLFPEQKVDFLKLEYLAIRQQSIFKGQCTNFCEPKAIPFTTDWEKLTQLYLTQLNGILGFDREYFLPSLQKKSAQRIHEILSTHISNALNGKNLSIRDLPKFFKLYAYQHSGFKKQFIDEFIRNSQPNCSHDTFYNPQYNALREWWFQRVINRQELFMSATFP
ncbi:Arm DNA-binding domain-containing protein [Undibacterium curvum]|uniref:Arm DNA-binding domain-containing protein n=1 Tax=Undibacterium curvum TaxID=2762294 RepID=UPI003D0EF1E9